MAASGGQKRKATTEIDTKIAKLEAENKELHNRIRNLQREKKLAEERCMQVVRKGAEDKSKLATEIEFLETQLLNLTERLEAVTHHSDLYLEGNLELMKKVATQKKELDKYMEEEI